MQLLGLLEDGDVLDPKYDAVWEVFRRAAARLSGKE
jgi:hypothetical protein